MTEAPVPLRVLTARRVITMEPGLPEGTAVAVRGDRIVEVGTLESLGPWLREHPHEVDDRFADAVLMPGFVDPHLHPALGALLLNYEIAAPEAWDLPGEHVAAVPDREAFLARLRDLAGRPRAAGEPLLVWGYNRYWHGPLRRQDLDAISDTLPIVVWQRSFHEIVAGTAALAWMDLEVGAPTPYGSQVNWEDGHFVEAGIAVPMARLGRYTGEPGRFGRGLRVVRDLVHRGGVTTAGDLNAGGTVGPAREWAAFREHLDGDEVPFRTVLVPAPHIWERRHGPATFDAIDGMVEQSTRRLLWRRAVKSFGDGAFISQLMRLCDPGYIDGHQGEWLYPPERLYALLEPYWRAGFDVYHHVNGDEGVDVVLDVLDALQRAHPRRDARFDLQHFGIARDDQVARLAALGASVSANGYYVYLFADRWSELGIGAERASQMTRLGSLAREGVRLSLHSDLPMGPVRPLLAAATAATRRSASGTVHAPGQRIPLDLALRAVTIDAAWALRMDRDVGSIAAGKKADFAVLDTDPYEAGAEGLRDVRVLGTVFEGRPYPVTGT